MHECTRAQKSHRTRQVAQRHGPVGEKYEKRLPADMKLSHAWQIREDKSGHSRKLGVAPLKLYSALLSFT